MLTSDPGWSSWLQLRALTSDPGWSEATKLKAKNSFLSSSSPSAANDTEKTFSIQTSQTDEVLVLWWSGSTALVRVLLPQQSPELLQDPGRHPGNGPVDPIYGDLQVVLSVFIWSRQVLTAEGAEQQSQEQVQDLKPDQQTEGGQKQFV